MWTDKLDVKAVNWKDDIVQRPCQKAQLDWDCVRDRSSASCYEVKGLYERRHWVSQNAGRYIECTSRPRGNEGKLQRYPTNDEEARRRQEYLTQSAKFQQVLRHYRQSTFILLKPVEEWLVDDGVRSMDNQTECLLIYRKLLSELGITYREIGPEMKDLAERVGFTMLAKL